MGEKNRHPHRNTKKNFYKKTKGFVVEKRINIRKLCSQKKQISLSLNP